MSFNANSGYIGWSMSERAYDAYQSGEMPLSHWTKTVLLDEIFENEEVAFTREEIKGFTLPVLREVLLYRSSWHHTGCYYNETDFYSVDEDRLYDREGTLALLGGAEKRIRDEKEKAAKEGSVPRKAIITFEQWEGSRRYGRFVFHTVPCYIFKGWAYTEEYGKKSLAGQHVYAPEYVSRAPKGTADKFRRIEKNLPLAAKKALIGIKR